MFSIFRANPNFPPIPPVGTTQGTESTGDNPSRGSLAAARNATRCLPTIQSEAWPARGFDVGQDQQFYLPYDSYRGRTLLGVFHSNSDNRAGVRSIVQALRGSAKYWEGRNEPNFFVSPQNLVTELGNFYADVHSQDIDGSLRVLGPGTENINPGSHGLGYIREFLQAGGGATIDGVSFHLYNGYLGDPFLLRRSMQGLVDLLTEFGQQNKEKWQTEQGFGAAVNGAHQPRLAGRWSMLYFMIMEQFGVPKEHNHLRYHREGGFWFQPSWWVNSDGSFSPVGSLVRVWSEELAGTRFTSAYDFGTVGNKLYIGSLFTGPGKKLATFISAGSTDGQVRLQVSEPSVHVVTAFGLERDVPAQNGFVLLPVTELPTYVKFTGSLAVVPQSWARTWP